MNKDKRVFFFLLFVWNALLWFAGRYVGLPVSLLPVLKYLLPFGIWLALRREKPPFLNMELGRVNAGLILILSVAVQPFLLLVVTGVSYFNPYSFPLTFSPRLADSMLPVSLFAYAAVPAVCEEAVFRGYLFSGGGIKKQAVVLSGLLFCLVQADLWGIPYAFATGVIFAFVTYCTRSVRAGAFMRLCVNAFQMVAGLFFAGYFSGVEQRANPPARQISAAVPIAMGQMRLVLTFCIASLIFLPVITIITRAFISHNRRLKFEADICPPPDAG